MGFNEKVFVNYVNSCPDFNNYVGTKLTEVHGGTAVMEVEMRPELCNRWGIPHGGLAFTMADTCAGMAAMSAGGRGVVTANASMNYLRPGAPEGKLTARARVVKHGRTLAFVHVEVTDGRGGMIATGEFTMAYTDRKLPGME